MDAQVSKVSDLFFPKADIHNPKKLWKIKFSKLFVRVFEEIIFPKMYSKFSKTLNCLTFFTEHFPQEWRKENSRGHVYEGCVLTGCS